MKTNGIGSGFTPAPLGGTSSNPQVTPPVSPTLSPTVGLASMGTSGVSAARPRQNLSVSPAALAEVNARSNELTSLLNSGGMAMLQDGLKTGFATLPPEHQSLCKQTARLLGLTNEPPPAGSAMPFPQMMLALNATVGSATNLAGVTVPSMETALRYDPQQRAELLAPHVTQLKDAGKIVAAAIAQTPVAELRSKENIEQVKTLLKSWADKTEALHEQIQALQLGDQHPVMTQALEARQEASAAYGKTIARMIVARGVAVYDLTVGKAIGAFSKLFGSSK